MNKGLNTTLTTIALASTLQCGWGMEEVTLTEWGDIISSTYSTQNGTTYTLKETYKTYKLKLDLPQEIDKNITFIIPAGITFEHHYSPASGGNPANVLVLDDGVTINNYGTFNNYTGMVVCFGNVTINNYGTFNNGDGSTGWLYSWANLTINNVKDATYSATFNNNMYVYALLYTSEESDTIEKIGTITFSGGGDIYNKGSIYTGGEGCTITFSRAGDIYNDGYILTYAKNSAITFSGDGGIYNDGYILTYAKNSAITFSGDGGIYNNAGDGKITNNGHIYTGGEGCTITFSGSGDIVNNVYIYTDEKNSAITFSGDGDIYNNGWITPSVEDSTITFSGSGNINNRDRIFAVGANSAIIFSQNIDTSGTSASYGQIYCFNGGMSTINAGTTFSFDDYTALVGSEDIHNVNLNGTLEFNSIESYFYNVNISSGSGTIDMRGIRTYPEEYSAALKTISNLSDNIYGISIASSSSPTAYLPFNCKFGNVDLSNAASVSYTVLKLIRICINGDLIMGDKDNIIKTYGDYADTNNDLGVTLPRGENGKIDMSKVHVRTKYASGLSLSSLISEMDGNQLKYNKSRYKLLTTDLDNATDTIAANITHDYNFGFTGTKAISITSEKEAENTKATFKGDNRGYNPGAPATISVAEVEFGASNSLFQFTKTYSCGTFSVGNFTNTIPEGATITFSKGFTLGAGHTLTVCGTLVG